MGNACPNCSPRRRESAPAACRDTPPLRANASSDGMVKLDGGAFLMGTDYAFGFAADGEGPVCKVRVKPFSIDARPVSNAQFEEFVQATKYQTEAERFGWSFVFRGHIPEDRYDELVRDTVACAPWWCQVMGATWRHPEGPDSGIEARQDFPVVHVSWNDAAAYSAWAGKRLPTEAEWEYAARGGLEQKLFPWGDELTPGGKHLCNVWQGNFPDLDTAEDGWSGPAPADAFPPNAFGLFGITGNVWEWCSDWFHAKWRLTAGRNNPLGPAAGTSKVIKGGSYLCHESYCNRYRVAARTSNTPDSSTTNIGFRCVR